MNQKLSAANKINKLNDEHVAEYLRVNPEFFESNLDVLTEIQIPHISGEGTTSLIERQVQVLREQIQSYQDQLKSFTKLASENEDLWYKIKDLALMLLKRPKGDGLAKAIEQWLKQQYNLAGVTIQQAQPSELLDKFQSEPRIRLVLEEGKIACGSDFAADTLALLFANDASNVKSCALIPLIDQQRQHQGLLALGSRNTDRFCHEQSTTYLDCLSQIISQSLRSA